VRRANRSATRKTIVAMQAGGRLEGIDAALVGLARVTADMLDEALADDEKGYALAGLGRLHLQTVLALTGKDAGTGDAGLAEIIAALSTPLGYPTDQPA
jgi:hypothetical protein